MKHRGRIQAQGDKLEESESWAQNKPLSKKEGLSMLEKLKSKLSRKDLETKEQPFMKAARFIKNAADNGGVSATVFKSFYSQNSPKERVDIEVRQGNAFVPNIKNED